ncbi:MAG TPA: formylglycine-generating enzyme family protein [Nitrospinaceae bacterium]|jgi:formylglycine-generating enzyme required for sulfatase activity|nr:formylglycine-generating enzyme family protein [Nitrospinaceae bacterium]
MKIGSDKNLIKVVLKVWSFLVVFLFLGFSGLGVIKLQAGEMVLIPEGSFLMGSTEKDIHWTVKHFHSESYDWYRDETPSHSVTVPAFFIDKYEVTVADYAEYMGVTGKPAPREFENSRFNHPYQPVVSLPWRLAREYCHWAKKRLPSEVEWEKAARGTDGRRYPWGNEPDALNTNIRGKGDSYRNTSQGGKFPEGASPYGVMDLSGNVWEWIEDWYQPYPGNKYDNDFYGETFKVIKGGSWNSNLDLARPAVRGKANPEDKKNYIGFRCVVSK